MLLQKLHFSLDSNKPQLFSRSISVVEEKLLPRSNISLGKDGNTMITIYHHNLCIAVWVDGVISQTDLVSLTSCIHNKIIIEIKQEWTHVFIVNFSSPISLILGNDLSTIFRYEFILQSTLFEINTPSSNITRSHQQVLMESSLYRNILACDLAYWVFIGSTSAT